MWSNKSYLIWVGLFFAVQPLSGQIVGGRNTFQFLHFSPSARVTALGGSLITVMDDDVNLAYLNPALLNPQMHQQLAFNHNFHLGGINHGYAAYGSHWSSLNLTWHAGVQYAAYGDFDLTDEFGQTLGVFKANEYALTLGAGREVDERLHMGANLKMISSQLEAYQSLGLAADLGIAYRDTAAQFLLTLALRNAGRQLTFYRENNREELPLDLQVGLSKRLRYLPFRFSVVYHHLHRWNILHDDPNTRENEFLFGDVETGRGNTSIFFDNFFRHFIFSGEFLIGRGENLRLRFGYNHQLRQELLVDGYGGLAGFSIGAELKINRFRIAYGHQTYHLAGGMNHLSISTSLREFQR